MFRVSIWFPIIDCDLGAGGISVNSTCASHEWDDDDDKGDEDNVWLVFVLVVLQLVLLALVFTVDGVAPVDLMVKVNWGFLLAVERIVEVVMIAVGF